ncbi:MAG: UDP-N-acetylmuramoyl-tripeptide--D-alanyl-D-alanine ligase [Candidatus Hydrogenedentota bacterium]
MSWSYTLAELANAIGAKPPKTDRRFASVSTDTRTLKTGDVYFALSGERFDGNQFVEEAFAKGAVAAVAAVDSAVGPCLVTTDPLTALQAFAAYHRARYVPKVIAITGSCGKTTAKDFAAAVLAARFDVVKTRGNLNNEIGCPLSLLQIDETTDAAVIEMGAAHRGNIAELCALARPTQSAITLIAPSHLEGFGSIENIAHTKGEIVGALPPDGVFYVNTDDEWCRRIGLRFSGEKLEFGSKGDVALEDCRFADDGELLLEVRPVGVLRLPLACRAHATNVLLAIAIGLRNGVTEFEGPLREASVSRLRFRILRIGSLEVIDDTYNASPASMAAAMQGLADRPGNGGRVAALGDMLELGAESPRLHREVGALAGQLGVSAVFALGEQASAIIDGARAAGVPRTAILPDHAIMAQAIHDYASDGDCVLVKGSRGMRMEKVIEALRALRR